MHLAVCVAVAFVAGLVDAMAGGGGILTIPAIATFGFAIPVVGGTNKVVGTCGSSTATVRFLLRGKIDFAVAGVAAVGAAAGAVAGARALVSLGRVDERLARGLFGFLLVAMALYLFFRPALGTASEPRRAGRATLALALATGVALGFYDGFFGPGTGSFLVFAMVRLFRFDFVTATGNAKLVNFASNVASLGTFIISGVVEWRVALPMGAACACGAWLGAALAIRNGPRFVRWIFLAVAIAVAARLIVAAAR